MPLYSKDGQSFVDIPSDIDTNTGVDKNIAEGEKRGYKPYVSFTKDGNDHIYMPATSENLKGAQDRGYQLSDLFANQQQTNKEQLDKTIEQQKTPMGYARGLAATAAKGGTLNWSDELAGLGRSSPEDAAAAVYNERLQQKAFAKEHPIVATGTELTTGFALPIAGTAGKASLAAKVATGAGLGAATGAISGAGAAEDTKDILPEAAKSAAIGGVIGGTIPAVSSAAEGAYKAGKYALEKGRNWMSGGSQPAQQEAIEKIGEPALTNFFAKGGLEDYTKGKATAQNFLEQHNNKVQLGNERAQDIQQELPYLRPELNQAKQAYFDTANEIASKRNDINQTALENQLNKQQLADELASQHPELIQSLRSQRKDIGNERNQFFDALDQEHGQSSKSIQLAQDINKSLQNASKDISEVDPKLIGQFAPKQYENMNYKQNVENALFGKADEAAGGKVVPQIDANGQFIPQASAGQALKTLTDLQTSLAQRTGGRPDVNGIYPPTSDPTQLAARRALSKLKDTADTYLGHFEDTNPGITQGYKDIQSRFAKNYQAEQALNGELASKMGKGLATVPNPGKVGNMLTQPYRNEQLTNILENAGESNPSIQEFASKLKSAAGEVAPNSGMNATANKLENRASLEALRQKAGTNKQAIDQLRQARAEYQNMTPDQRLQKLAEQYPEKTPADIAELSSLLGNAREAVNYANQQSLSRQSPISEGVTSKVQNFLKGKVQNKLTPSEIEDINKAVPQEDIATQLQTIGERYSPAKLGERPTHVSAHGAALAASQVAGSPGYRVAYGVIDALQKGEKSSLGRLGQTLRAKNALNEFKNGVINGTETSEDYYRLLNLASRAGIDVHNLGK